MGRESGLMWVMRVRLLVRGSWGIGVMRRGAGGIL